MTNKPRPPKRYREEEKTSNPPKRPATRSTTAPGRQAAIDAETARQKAEADRVEKERQELLNSQPPSPAGTRGDGQLHLAFIQMGLGDCTMITTPQGRVIMIDCGSDSSEQDDNQLYVDGVRG